MATRGSRARNSSVSFTELLDQWNMIQNADDLVNSMVNNLAKLSHFLAENVIDEKYSLILVKLFSRASQTRKRRIECLDILRIIAESLFLTRHLGVTVTKIQEMFGLEQCQGFVKDMANILEMILHQLPMYSFKVIVAASLLNCFCSNCDSFPEKENLMSLLVSLIQQGKHQHRNSNSKENTIFHCQDTDRPPENFVDLPVVPTDIDLFYNVKPFVRKAILKGPYRDVEHYLDVHFRLMRLDFITPLKNGLTELRTQSDFSQKLRCSEVRLYHSVCIKKADVTNGLILMFDVKKCKHVDWERTDRLMTGSLLCLTKDGFRTIVCATVVKRELEQLKKGVVQVAVKSGLELLLGVTSRDLFVMAESVNFYDPYYHVLEALKSMTDSFPLQNVIIYCKPALKPPAYLLTYSSCSKIPLYDLSCMMLHKCEIKVPILTTVKWPSVSKMCLNESQREAAILALTKEVAVIQGPPGTGKTYVGLKVVETLLKNQKCKGQNSGSPILVVCFTNHALDQFLEGILRFCPRSITRIGGGCKSEKLYKSVLRNPASRYNTVSLKAMDIYKQEMGQLLKKIDSLDKEIQSVDVLYKFMLVDHYSFFFQNHDRQLRSWLCAPKGTIDQELPKQIQAHLTKLVLGWQFSASNIKLHKKLDVFERCSLYCNKIKIVRRNIKTEMEFAKRDKVFQTEKEMKQLLSLSYSDILPDDVIDQFSCSSFSEHVRKYCISPFKTFEILNENKVIQFWLLGQGRLLIEQLEDIEQLIQANNNGKDEINPVAQDQLNFRSSIFYKPENPDFESIMRKVEYLKIAAKTDDFQDKPTLNFPEVMRKMSTTEPMTEEEEKKVHDMAELTLKQRYSLYKLWLKRYREHLGETCVKKTEQFKLDVKKERDTDNERAASSLKRSQVIGMTTTGAAKYKDILEKVGCNIVIVEEAAEVLESHIVTALSKNCQHLILIGDHQQLRPKPATYELERNFGLDVSLFERLILNEIPHVTLKIQHRMRPEISQMVKLIYPELEDHPSVCQFEHIRGVSKDVFFINHNYHEVGNSDNFSKSNDHEAKYVVALCEYLTKHDYSPSQITIITTYKGQVTLIRKYMKNLNPQPRVSAVDDFQGEENEIIILSLVRSNKENIAGFVKIDNRVCVAFSRAKKGLFVIGNFSVFLASKSNLWHDIVEIAKKDNFFGQGLPVQCSSHPENIAIIKTADGFKSRDGGGCGLPCNFLLKCGHQCQLKCHGHDLKHERYKCTVPCTKTCEEGHQCTLKCHEKCLCKQLVTKTLPICGHVNLLPCHVWLEDAICSARCGEVLACGHECTYTCRKCTKLKRHGECKEIVEYVFTSCGHEALVSCSKSKLDIRCEMMCLKKLNCGHDQLMPCHLATKDAKCSSGCSEQLPCGHLCTGQCIDCVMNRKHKDCPVPIDYVFPSCGHVKNMPCFLSQTTVKCQVLCPAKLSCGHHQQIPCHVDPENAKCTEKCSATLTCGHTCTGQCTDCVTSNRHKECRLLVEYTYQQCGHKKQVQCFQSSTSLDCPFPCKTRLKCGHTCTGKCHDCVSNKKHKDCTVPVNYMHTKCGHSGKVQCYQSTTNLDCKQPCPSKLKCGHQCKGTCSDCLYGLVHKACQETCNLPLPCGHKCEGHCSTPCLPCKKPCQFKCRHRSCDTKSKLSFCGQPCQTCDAKCMQKCKHFVNLRLCSEAWDKDTCSERCTKQLKVYIPGNNGTGGKFCSHPCSGLCGEMCVCSICESIQPIRNLKSAAPHKKENTSSANVQTNTSSRNLILKLPLCGHAFYLSELDQYVAHHNLSSSGRYIYCPVCPKPILNCLRYDQINWQRRKQREQDEKDLIQRNIITLEQKSLIEKCKHFLAKFEDIKLFKYHKEITPEFNTRTEFLNHSLKVKFIYIVCLMKFADSDTEDLSSRSDLIQVIDRSAWFTKQLEQELRQEILRRLNLYVLAALTKYCSDQDFGDIKCRWVKLKEDYSATPVRADVQAESHQVIVSLLNELDNVLEQHPSDYLQIKNNYVDVVNILTSNQENILSDVVCPSTLESDASTSPLLGLDSYFRSTNKETKCETVKYDSNQNKSSLHGARADILHGARADISRKEAGQSKTRCSLKGTQADIVRNRTCLSKTSLKGTKVDMIARNSSSLSSSSLKGNITKNSPSQSMSSFRNAKGNITEHNLNKKSQVNKFKPSCAKAETCLQETIPTRRRRPTSTDDTIKKDIVKVSKTTKSQTVAKEAKPKIKSQLRTMTAQSTHTSEQDPLPLAKRSKQRKRKPADDKKKKVQLSGKVHSSSKPSCEQNITLQEK
ncbi:NFX1-type zinc finger-containing protein 1-like [Biomphalaria glabrata]|uniref:NFX1-type zinc finger-containing protein 1-like n=1 Tax=Biomphalaria glabrata TaxID=6526 RepID=A0A9W3AVY7_BIOGL|nr:NFX1-type zinc finger-containing protein 1-like [Biomphalaria glabrata]KAI8762185.1 NFX1-type zinc finger-containing protein 1-like [Biomphalaria glabrata]